MEPKEKQQNEGSLDLEEEDLIQFFNMVNANKVSTEVLLQQNKASPVKEEEKKSEGEISEQEIEASLNEEMGEIEVGQSDRLLCGDCDEVPEDSIGDILQKLEGQTINESSKEDWSKPFPWDKAIQKANREIFCHESFKENQLEVINAAKSGRDVLTIMPTGSGKSLTFQLCAVTDKGITFIIMPLLSLTIDQTNGLKLLGVNAIFFKSGIQTSELRELIMKSERLPKIIYLTPEKLVQTQDFIELLEELNKKGLLSRFVIDEAHCISQWGREFRPDYLNLSRLRNKFENVPILALTATATPVIRNDIIQKLNMKKPVIIQGKFGRPNIYFEVKPKFRVRNLMDDIGNFIKTKYPSDCGIMYCTSKRECEDAVRVLRTNYKISCDFYHGGMCDKDKRDVQRQWMEEKVKLVIATIAFGLGIDKANVRYVIHYSMPKSMECYIQECGRAGRDGLPSHCLTYYDINDKKVHEYLLAQGKKSHEGPVIMKYVQSNIHKMIDYCEEQYICRRQMQFEYFGEPFSLSDCENGCDNCKFRKGRGILKIFQKEARLAVDLIHDIIRQNRQITLLQTVCYLHGKNKTKLDCFTSYGAKRFYGCLKLLSFSVIRSIMIKLLVNRVLREDLYQGKQSILAYLEFGKREKLFTSGNLTIKVMVNNDAKLVQENPKEFHLTSRPYAPSKTKLEDPFFSLAYVSKGRIKDTLKTSDIKNIMQESDISAIIGRLKYIRQELILKNEDNKKLLYELFTSEVFLNIANNLPRDTTQLRQIIETHKWSLNEEQAFDKYGKYFIYELAHYINVYILMESRGKEVEESRKRTHIEGHKEEPKIKKFKKDFDFL